MQHKPFLSYQQPTTAPTPAPTTSAPTTSSPTLDPGFDLDVLRPHLTNLAKSKTAEQSSTCYSGDPIRVIDDNINGNYRAGSVNHTCWEWEPWWQVDLSTANGKEVSLQETKETSRIFAVTLFNRDSYTERIGYAKVEILNVYGHVVASRYLGDMSGVFERTLTFGIPSGGNKYGYEKNVEDSEHDFVFLSFHSNCSSKELILI